MNPELEALLERIEAAGGPVSLSITKNWASITYPGTDNRSRPYSTERDNVDMDVALIHALKLDAQQRNHATLATQGAVTGRRNGTLTQATDWKVLIWPADHPSINYDATEHPSEATAWAQAWLAAFEKATE